MNVTFEGDNVIISKTDFMELMNTNKIEVKAVQPVLAVNEVKEEKHFKNLECEITDYLDRKGFKSRNIKGFRYIRTAIILCMDKPDLLSSVTKELYPTIAKEYNTTSSRVERAIRHSIEIVFQKDKPTNSEFIAMAADEIRLGN